MAIFHSLRRDRVADYVAPRTIEKPTLELNKELAKLQALFQAQAEPLQRFLEEQGRRLAEAVSRGQRTAMFQLPEEITLSANDNEKRTPLPIRPGIRRQWVGRPRTPWQTDNLCTHLNKRFDRLERNPDPAISASAALIRYVTAETLVKMALNEEARMKTNSAKPNLADSKEHELMFVETLQQGEENIAKLRERMNLLNAAALLAPYIVVHEGFRRKYADLHDQLLQQGRSLALRQTCQIIERIHQRAARNSLNRGLSLSLPYFDGLTLTLRHYRFEVIPRGRIMFVPAFVVLAARREQENVAHQAQMDSSTRAHLLAELKMLEQAFLTYQIGAPDPGKSK